ncbi:hypothetical protein HPB52_025398 [Rhipicephalus sanguineus]|uniref:Uncharacterized protein n=1 Tax=Rhipicephalus sanguineus TaxID=34632 RepID=A0A9D4YRD2_RHISA|nr:hypothetical protein HPB52_025398 [Rhipicephalus sanguineus]
MRPRLCLPVPPFHPAYRRAWVMQLDAILALNSITAQRLTRVVMLHAVMVELCNLAAASTSSTQPYDDLCAAKLACCGKTQRPLRASRVFLASPLFPRAVPTGPLPSLAQDLTPPATPSSTSRPANSASITTPDHPPDEVKDVPVAMNQSTERSVFSAPSARGPSGVPAICTSSPTCTAHDTCDMLGSTTATSLHALESAIATDIVSPAISLPVREASPSTASNQPDFSSA